MRRTACALFFIAVAAVSAHGQSNETAGSTPAEANGVITGRVLDDTGQPVFNADVRVYEAGSTSGFGGVGAALATDEDGKFRADGLGAHAYTLEVSAAGYVEDTQGPSERGFHYVGEVVTLRVRKGGVVTGKVARADGEPVIAVEVNVTMTRNAEGRRVADWDRMAYTDDRGIYRVYGLEEGTYLVSATGQTRGFFRRTASFTSDDAPTYYPSAPIEGAAEVQVRSGQEVTGIDITYRGERGHKASGVVAGAENKRGWVTLRRVTPSVDIASDDTEQSTGVFEFSALPDGEYEAIASMYGDNAIESTSPPVRFTVRGSDVAGLRLVLAPVSSLAGKVVLTGLPAADATVPCPAKSSRSVGEIVMRIENDDPAKDRPSSSRSGTAAVSAAGEFKEASLRASRVRVTPRLPDDGWYVQSIVRAEDGKKTPVDVARDGLSVGAGQDVKGIVVTISAGAAIVSGRVTPVEEGAKLADMVRIHLVPAEPDAGDAPLRFYSASTERDGTFEIKNVAPGAYRAIAVPEPAERDGDPPYRPAAWDAAKRAALRKTVAALPEVRLDPCAHETSIVLHPIEVKALFAAPRAR